MCCDFPFQLWTLVLNGNFWIIEDTFIPGWAWKMLGDTGFIFISFLLQGIHFFFIKSFHWRQYSESGSGVWSLITVKMKSTSIMETGRQKEDIKWIPTQTIRKKVGHWVSQSFGSECRTALLCRCLCFCARGTTYTNTRRPGDLIMPNKNNDIDDDDDYDYPS